MTTFEALKLEDDLMMVQRLMESIVASDDWVEGVSMVILRRSPKRELKSTRRKRS